MPTRDIRKDLADLRRVVGSQSGLADAYDNLHDEFLALEKRVRALERRPVVGDTVPTHVKHAKRKTRRT